MSRDRFPPVPTGYPFPRLEQEVLARWREGRIFERSLERPAPRGEFVLYDGPPTANNVPHVGHVVTRVVKDLYPRYRTMCGFHAPRKAGWDTHGLPVEIEVEKALGFSGKQEIEDYGIAAFNERCLESVHTYERQWRAMSERVGHWIDMDDAYFTYTNEYVESVWWALKTLWEKELLVEGYKIQPYCARCGTTLSSHEVAQNYKQADDPSVWVRFPLRQGQEIETKDGGRLKVAEGLAMVAWTTTPWTLLSNVALAVNPDLTYKMVANPVQQGGQLILAEGLESPVPILLQAGGDRKLVDLREAEAEATFLGSALKDLEYDRPYHTSWEDRPTTPPPTPARRHLHKALWGRVVLGDYVTLTDGTGIVHTAPLYGEDDYQTGRRYGLGTVRAVGEQGTVRKLEGVPEDLTGLWFKDADPEIQRDLKQRGLLLHAAQYRHNYPFCWRCDRPLLYYAWDSWFVATTKAKGELIAQNRTIGWHPAHVGEGRFGNWLENVVDWALSRNRYWGTPLPVWRCDVCEHVEVMGSFAELFSKAGRELPVDPYDRDRFDPHRPFVDRRWRDAPDGWEPFTWSCPAETCSGTVGRVDDVIDAWFDSGSMPFAQYHYPFENEALVRQRFPADLIAEAVDQTRGWFYTLHVLGTLLFGSHAYDDCIVLGHVNDEEGRKMSKRLGNVVEPMAVMEETGADALRWYFCVDNPTASSRFSARLVREAAQSFLLPLWNAVSFFTIYANLDGWRPPAEGAAPLPFAARPPLDRWVLLRLDGVVREVGGHLDAYRTTEAARALEGFVEELTNWYIRRSRGRFWAADGPPGEGGGGDGGKESAYRALFEVLVTLARLLAPFTPFLAEVLHGNLVRSQGGGADSVHLEDWPAPPEGAAARAEPELEAAMAAIQRIVRLGHAARNTHGIKTRQPLAAVTLVAADEALPARVAPYEGLLRDELNVHAVRWAADRSEYVHHEVKPVFPKTGPRFGRQMKEVQAALAAADGDALAAELEADGAITLALSTGPAELSSEEVEVRLVERAGTATQGDRELLVALETELTPELVAEGRAREVVHLVQSARKDLDLDYADRIRVRYAAGAELAAAVAAHRDWIAGETLAAELAEADGELPPDAREASVEGDPFRYTVERAAS
jgi:isoleucyl-tRNA synthetase